MTEKELHIIFSANVKKHRSQFGWTQAIAAKKIGTSVNFVNDIETGKKWASPKTMVKMANAFKVEVYELLKPQNLLPDNVSSIIKQYTDDVHTALEQTYTRFLDSTIPIIDQKNPAS